MRMSILLMIGFFLLLSPVYANDEGHHMKGHHMSHEAEHNGDDAGICPVLHSKASKRYSYEYGGKTYYFCCAGCIEEFKKDPQKYISKMKGELVVEE